MGASIFRHPTRGKPSPFAQFGDTGSYFKTPSVKFGETGSKTTLRRRIEEIMESPCSWCHQGNNSVKTPVVPLLQHSLKSPRCPLCQRAIALVSVTTASAAVNVSRKTIYQWIEKGLVSTVRSAGGRQLVCFSSLFNQSCEAASLGLPAPFKKTV